MKSSRKAVPVTVTPKPGVMQAVHVTVDNLDDVIEWLNFDLGTCEARDNRIYTMLYDESGGGIIDPGEWLIRLGHRVTLHSSADFDRLFDLMP